MTTSISAPGITELIVAVKHFMKGVSDIINYFLSLFGIKLGTEGLVGLNILLLVFVGYIIWENKPLKYLALLIIIMGLLNIVGLQSLFKL